MIKRLIMIMMAILLIFSGMGNAIKWEQMDLNKPIPGGMGIGFSGTPPSTTTNKIYIDGSTLKFNGHDALLGGYDALIRAETGGYFAYAQNGNVIASDTSSPYDFGAVLNTVTSGGYDKTILIDGDFITSTTGIIGTGTKLIGVGDSSISTSNVMTILSTQDTDTLNKYIVIEDLHVYYTGTDIPTTALIELFDPIECTVRGVTATCPNVASYSDSYRGSLSLTSDISSTWLNKIEYCTLNQIRFTSITDSVIQNCAINTYGKGPQAIKFIGTCNNNKILHNEIVCDTTYGIYMESATWDVQITGNYFEANGHTPTAGNTETAIFIGDTARFCTINDNHIEYINGYGIRFKGMYSLISNNMIVQVNNADNSYADISIYSGHSNMVIGNYGANDRGSAHKAPMIETTDYNVVYNNHAKGDGYSIDYVAGANCIDDNNVLWGGAIT